MKKTNKLVCNECGFITVKTGMASHLLYTHKITVNEYIQKHGEYRVNKLKLLDNNTGNFTCLICNDTFFTNKRLLHHIKSIHNTQSIAYIKQYIFNNIPQLCPCGCKQEVKYIRQPPYKLSSITGHNSRISNGMKGKIVSDTTKILQSKAAIERGVIAGKKDTNIETQFIKYLEDNNISYIKQFKTDYGVIDFYLKDLDILVEIDGSFWHPAQLINLNFNQLSNVCNDIKKNSNLKNLVRITDNDIKNNTIDLSINNITTTNVNNYDIFLSKEFLENYRQTKGEQHLRNKINLIYKFIKSISPEFPYDNINGYDLLNVCDKLSSRKTVLEGKTFYNNRCSYIGSRELKSLFKSFYSSKNFNSYTPVEVWNNELIMKKLIEYRIGLNKNNEVFNISLNQIRQAITVNKFTVSWFKPHLAMSIYKEFLGDIQSPVVLDPCAGFGARMLGFYSAYPNGTYIGVEPNPHTFSELVELNRLLGKSSVLINDKYENVDVSKLNYNIAFTSIPYWDTEIYSTNHTIDYNNYQDWVDTFLNKIKTTKDMVVNVPERLYKEFDTVKDTYYIKNNNSHFSKNKTDNLEYILFL
jgi:hypothetical protein